MQAEDDRWPDGTYVIDVAVDGNSVGRCTFTFPRDVPPDIANPATCTLKQGVNVAFAVECTPTHTDLVAGRLVQMCDPVPGHVSGRIEVLGLHDAVAVSVQRDSTPVLTETAYPAYLSVQPYAYCTRCDMSITTLRVPK